VSKIYEVRSIARRDGKTHGWGVRYSRNEAELLLAKQFTGANQKWADQYHQRWWIEEIDTTGLFVVPPSPPLRARYSTQVSVIETAPGSWETLHVEVLDETRRIVAAYDRNHPNLEQTFEPFRQGDRLFALISTDYTATSVIDLRTGAIIASEEPNAAGFCPVGFYVPDWWDVNDGSKIPGSMYWVEDDENPRGDFGFVWGCVWGDDSCWKVQYLDLSQVQDGKILRDDRFGYVRLAADRRLAPKDFIQCSFHRGERRVTFATLSSYDLRTGAPAA